VVPQALNCAVMLPGSTWEKVQDLQGTCPQPREWSSSAKPWTQTQPSPPCIFPAAGSGQRLHTEIL